MRGPYPGAITEPEGDTGPESGGWRLRADVALWPLTTGDKVLADDGRVFYVRNARLVKVPGAPAVDHIKVTADLDPPKRV